VGPGGEKLNGFRAAIAHGFQVAGVQTVPQKHVSRKTMPHQVRINVAANWR
jgi:hypothetical protein